MLEIATQVESSRILYTVCGIMEVGGTLFKEAHKLAVARIKADLFTIRPKTAPSMIAPIMYGCPACQKPTG